ncbi:NAD(P)-binding protein [Polychaeton citri CBS 116435]|uniref:NAD(P)-binding protein n=1 Tax=Polychaeton citri CBS 116435 TaxID=1314669 RepID=A0A9P4Q192_9PEZI|nr:NAD(P)-binding protein [Polychaeton citri CBS 116435]
MTTKQTLNGKVAIVTGASRGIGESIALGLAARGAKIVLTYSSDRSKPAAEAIVRRIADESNSEAIHVQCDLTSTEAPSKIVEAAVGVFGHVDILVNNAAMISGSKVEEITAEHFDEVFHLNVRAPLLMVQAVLPHLHRPGRIVNISSVGARAGFPGVGTYAASKAALEGYTRNWATELGSDGTTVNAVNPGPVESEMLDQVPASIKEPQKQATPVEKRCGKPEEIANIVAWLASEESSWVTGQCISATGGYAMY